MDTSVLIEPPSTSSLPQTSFVSVLSVGELEIGVLLAATVELRSERLARLSRVRVEVEALPVDGSVVQAFALLVAASRQLGRDPKIIDTLIAATAEANGLTLYTRDRAQARLPGIDVVLLLSG